jgi:hypothetical protein
VFLDHKTLYAHMRKKKHMRLNPTAIELDRFFVSSYVEEEQTWRARLAAHQATSTLTSTATSTSASASTLVAADDVGKTTASIDNDEESDGDWSDWVDDDGDAESDSLLACLFCHQDVHSDHFGAHVSQEHKFCPPVERVHPSARFHAVVACANYVVDCLDALRCPRFDACDEKKTEFPSREALLRHAHAAGHLSPSARDPVNSVNSVVSDGGDGDPEPAREWDWWHARFLRPSPSTTSNYSEV